MFITKFGDKNNTKLPVCVALGFFDSLHKGHAAIINNTIAYARRNNYVPAVMTFDNNPFIALNKDIKLVYTFSERCEILKAMGVSLICAAEFNGEFMSLPAESFLETLKACYDVKYISCGADYTFGKNSSGGISELAEFCLRNGIAFEVQPEICIGGIKVSSTYIRERLKEGDIENANKFLNLPYCLYGRVGSGRRVGGRLTYPTANITPTADKELLAAGVYAGNVYISGEKHMSVINAGGKPTFDENSYGIEAYVLDYNSDLYGQYIKVEFIKRLRGIKAFASAAELKAQITLDIEARKNLEHAMGIKE